MSSTRSLISVVDDGDSVRESLPDLIGEFGFAVRAFASVDVFLASYFFDGTHWLVADLAMPGMTGPQLQRELLHRKRRMSTAFISAHRDETVRSLLLRRGAVACLFKPFSETDLFEALTAAIDGGSV